MTICVSGCAQLPQIRVVQTECIWSRPLSWTTEQADALVDCCPELARAMLTHNAMHQEFCK